MNGGAITSNLTPDNGFTIIQGLTRVQRFIAVSPGDNNPLMIVDTALQVWNTPDDALYLATSLECQARRLEPSDTKRQIRADMASLDRAFKEATGT